MELLWKYLTAKTIFAKSSILDVWQHSKCVSDVSIFSKKRLFSEIYWWFNWSPQAKLENICLVFRVLFTIFIPKNYWDRNVSIWREDWPKKFENVLRPRSCHLIWHVHVCIVIILELKYLVFYWVCTAFLFHCFIVTSYGGEI